MAYLQLDHITKSIGGIQIRDICLSLEKRKTLCLLGPSGSGKSTLLRMIAGLEPPDVGRVLLNGMDITHHPPHQRKLGLMFQDFALFPHRTVFQNVAFGLEMQHKHPKEIESKTIEMLAWVKLSDLAHRNVAALSGGERQRVALARSLAPQPALLMLDEPLGSLDRALREELIMDIHTILKELEITAIFVTHDQTEAFSVSDVIGVMNKGQIEQFAPPLSLYHAPKNLFVANFLGFDNILPGVVTKNALVTTPIGTVACRVPNRLPGQPVSLVIRPESATTNPADSEESPLSPVKGRVVSRSFRGAFSRIRLAVDANIVLTLDLPGNTPLPEKGSLFRVWLHPNKMSVMFNDDKRI